MNVPYLLPTNIDQTEPELQQVYDFLKEVEPEWRRKEIFQAVRAVDVGYLNRMLRAHGAEPRPKLSEVAPSKPTYRLGQQRAPSGQIELDKLRGILFRALGKTFGPSWYDTATDRDNYVSEALQLWIEQYGEAATPTPETVHAIALAVRRGAKETRKKFRQADATEADVLVDPTAERKFMIGAAEDAEETSRLGEIESYLLRLSKGGEADQFRGLIIGLHLGHRVVPGQPLVLVGEGPNSNLIRFHKMMNVSKPCPTCKSIARYIRAPGLTADRVGVVINQFMADLASELRRGV